MLAQLSTALMGRPWPLPLRHLVRPQQRADQNFLNCCPDGSAGYTAWIVSQHSDCVLGFYC